MSCDQLRRSLFLEPIPDEAGLGLLMRTARRFGYTCLQQLFSLTCPELSGRVSFNSQEGQLTTLCRWVGPVLDLSCDEVLSRFSDIALHRLLLRDLMRVERVALSSGQEAERISYTWLTVLGAGPLGAQYCRECAAEQYREFGCTSWLRSHNLPHVRVCTKHGCWLDALDFTAYEVSLPPVQTKPPELAETRGAPSVDDLKVARLLGNLLQADLPWIGHDLRAKLFRHRLHKIETGSNSTEEMHALYDVLSDPTAQRLLMPGLKTAIGDIDHVLRVLRCLYGGGDLFISAVREAVARPSPSRGIFPDDAPGDVHYLSLRPVNS